MTAPANTQNADRGTAAANGCHTTLAATSVWHTPRILQRTAARQAAGAGMGSGLPEP